MSTCKVIALCNQKGGVGKTTTCLNLGVGLANKGNKVLLIDADAQASLTISLGYQNPDDMDTTLYNVMQMTMNEKSVPDGYAIIPSNEGVDLLPANIDLANLEVQLISAMSREMILRGYINSIRRNYDYILIDCMPSLGMITMNALVAADSVIIPAQPHFLSIKGLETLLSTIVKVKRHLNTPLKIEGIIMTMVDRRTNFAKEIISTMRERFNQSIKVFEAEIPLSVKAVETTAEGKSIFLHDKNGKVAQAYQALTKEVLVNGEQQRIKNRMER